MPEASVLEGRPKRRPRQEQPTSLPAPKISLTTPNSMAQRLSRTTLGRLNFFAGTQCTKQIPAIYPTIRAFHASSAQRTDGVFKELTAQRLRTPWIEALRKQQAAGKGPSQASETPQTPKERDLTPKKMTDSFHKVVLPLANDPWLLDTYLNASGHIRLGTIFMDLDALSGVIAYKHTGEDVTTVTASCDRIVINHPLTEICDLELSGKVTYATGRSSMEITMQVAKAPREGEAIRREEDVLIHCTMTMVALDPETRKYVYGTST